MQILAVWAADLLAQTGTPVDGLAGYGAIGLIAAICIGAIIALNKRQNSLHDATVTRLTADRDWERARADRLERELLEMYRAALPALEASTKAVRDATGYFTDAEREREIRRRLEARDDGTR